VPKNRKTVRNKDILLSRAVSSSSVIGGNFFGCKDWVWTDSQKFIEVILNQKTTQKIRKTGIKFHFRSFFIEMILKNKLTLRNYYFEPSKVGLVKSKNIIFSTVRAETFFKFSFRRYLRCQKLVYRSQISFDLHLL